MRLPPIPIRVSCAGQFGRYEWRTATERRECRVVAVFFCCGVCGYMVCLLCCSSSISPVSGSVGVGWADDAGVDC